MGKETWALISNVIVAIVPVFMSMAIVCGVWVTKELYAAKYQMVTVEEVDERLDARNTTLLSEINRLRDTVDELNQRQAETLAEVRLLHEIILREPD